MPLAPPLDFQRWIAENRHLLKPPVANKCIYDGDFIVMVVGGPNQRTDYHVDEGPEFFYQLEGEMVLRIQEDGQPRDIPIRAGEVFYLPPNVPHSPQRMADSIGLVVERLACERSAASRAALVDQHDVTMPPHLGQPGREGRERARRLTGPAGEDQQRIGLRVERVRREHRGEHLQRPSLRPRAILGHLDLGAPERGRVARQPAVRKCRRAGHLRFARARRERDRERRDRRAHGEARQAGARRASRHRGGW